MSIHQNFEQQKKKLETLWNLLNSTENITDNPERVEEFLNKNQINDEIFTVFESGFTAFPLFDPGTYANLLAKGGTGTEISTTKTGIVSSNCEFEFRIPNLDIPEYFFPFLNYNIITKSIPNVEFRSVALLTEEHHGKTEKLVVGGTEIFNGIPFSNKEFPNPKIWTQIDIDNGIVNENSLKNAWSTTQQNGIICDNSGIVRRIRIKYDREFLEECANGQNYKEFVIDYDRAKHNITNLTSTSVSGIGTVYQHTFHNNIADSCQTEVITTINNKVAVSLNFSQWDNNVFDLTEFGGYRTETRSFEIITFDGNGEVLLNPGDTLPSQVLGTPVQIGFILYWGNNKHAPLVSFDTNNGDSIVRQKFEGFLPKDEEDVFRSFDDPNNLSGNLGNISLTPQLTNEGDKFVGGEQLNIGFFKLNEKADKYLLTITGALLVITRGAPNIVNKFANQKKNTYVWSGEPNNRYNRNDGASFDSEEFLMNNLDIQIKVVITLKNPFYYRIEENFNVE